MNEERTRPIAGLTVVFLAIGAIVWLALSGCSGNLAAPESAERAGNSLPTQDLTELGATGGLQFLNGYANW